VTTGPDQKEKSVDRTFFPERRQPRTITGVQPTPEYVQLAIDAAVDASLPTCERCEGDGCAGCSKGSHDIDLSGFVEHECICVGTGIDPVSLAHLLIGIDEAWSGEALELLATVHLEGGTSTTRCEECEADATCVVLDLYLSADGQTWSDPHTPYMDGECGRCSMIATLS
jgi:hypothetical protein